MASQYVRQMVAAGWAFVRAGNQGGAVRQFRAALTEDPEDVEALAGLCQTNLDLGEFRESEEQADTLLRLQPNLAAAHRFKGEILRRRRQLGRALEFSERAVQLDPEDPLAYHFLAVIHFDRKNFRAALETVSQGRVVAPGFAPLAAQQALILLQMKGGKTAWPVAEEALRLGMDDDYVLSTVARIAIAHDRLEQARDLLETVLRRNANDEDSISLYLLTDPGRYGFLRAQLQFPSWRKENGVIGWIAWFSAWSLFLLVAIALVVGTNIPGIAIGLGYRFFWHAQYLGHRREVKRHFAQPALKTGY